MRLAGIFNWCWPVAFSLLLSGCGEGSYDEIEMMPPPVVYSASGFNPFPPPDTKEFETQSKLFYVTDRGTAGPDDKQPHYTNERG